MPPGEVSSDAGSLDVFLQTQVSQQAHHEAEVKRLLLELHVQHEHRTLSLVEEAVSQGFAKLHKALDKRVSGLSAESPNSFSEISAVKQRSSSEKEVTVEGSHGHVDTSKSSSLAASIATPRFDPSVKIDAKRGVHIKFHMPETLDARSSQKTPKQDNSTSNSTIGSPASLKTVIPNARASLTSVAAGGSAGSTHSTLDSITRREGLGARIARLVMQPQFDYAVGIVIVLNVLAIALQTDWAAQHHHETEPEWFRPSHRIFLAFFTLELMLRITAEKKHFLHGRNRGWNFFDTCVVVLSIIEESIDFVANAKLIRILRLLRLVRIVKFVRVCRFFADLRVMVGGIVHSFKSLFWALVLLLMIKIIFGVYLTQVITHELTENNGSSFKQLSSDELDEVKYNYGSLTMTIYSLFKAISSGMDWGRLSDPLLMISKWYSLFFCAYISLVVFAILNIVTGVFVETAIKSTQHDADIMMWEEAETRNKLMEDVQKVFQKADVDSSGSLDWHEFEKHIGDPRVQQYLRQLDLDIETSGTQGLFRLLDFDGNGVLDSDEFIMGCSRLKGHARSLDLARVSHNQRGMSQNLRKIDKEMETMRTHLQEINQRLDKSDRLSTDACTIPGVSEGSGPQRLHPAMGIISSLSL